MGHLGLQRPQNRVRHKCLPPGEFFRAPGASRKHVLSPNYILKTFTFLYFFVFFQFYKFFLCFFFLFFFITVHVYFCFARLEELMLVLTIIDERDFRQYFHFFAKLFLMKDFVFSVISTFFDVFGRASIYLMISVESVSTYLFSLVFLRFYFFENRYLLFLSH